MINFNIKPVSKELASQIQHKIDNKTKPLGSLGLLEDIAFQICCIQNTLSPQLKNPTMIVFAGDHGISKEGVSKFPQEVTYQMVMNFLKGGAAINVFTRQHGIGIKVVDAGVIGDFEPHLDLIIEKIAHGTQSFLHGPAMTKDQCIKAMVKASDIIENISKDGCNIIGFGEMGISNTSSATMLLSVLSDIPIEECVGRGTGIDDETFNRKKSVLKQAYMNNYINDITPIEALSIFGGFEIAMMTGAMLKSAELGMILLIDGAIATSALLAAFKINPDILDYCIFCHKSKETSHSMMLEQLGMTKTLLDIDLRLGEGTGAAVAYPIIQSAVAFINEMASFESANVSGSEIVNKQQTALQSGT